MAAIAIPDHLRTLGEQEVDAGRVASAERLIVAALERMADDRTIHPHLIEEVITDALAEADCGDKRKFTREVTNGLSAQARVNAGHGLSVLDDIKCWASRIVARGAGC
jgi:hypothetical protein